MNISFLLPGWSACRICAAFMLVAVVISGCSSTVGTGGTGTSISALPVNGTTGIAAMEGLQLMVTGSLDQASVDAASATFEGGTSTVTGTVTYDPVSGIVTITPTRRLDNDATYKLTLTGVRDAAGTLLAPIVVTFTTNLNVAAKEYYYFSFGGHVRTGSLTSYDAKGRIIEEVASMYSGNDGVWLTDDDIYTSVSVRQYNYSGSEARLISYTGPGADGIWKTSDDTFNNGYSVSFFDAMGRLTRGLAYPGPGPDGIWFTADDISSTAGIWTYDSKGNMTGNVTITGPGADGLWFTADDSIMLYSSTTYAPDGSWSLTKGYFGAGADGIWFTADDFVTSEIYTAYERDSVGNLVREVTDSSFISNKSRTYKTYSYDDKGCLRRSVTYKGPGGDGVWFTVDDEVDTYSDTSYDAKGNKKVCLSYCDPGSDGVWFTTDDMEFGRKEF